MRKAGLRQRWKTAGLAEGVDGEVARERAVPARISQRAEQSDVAAVEWLEKRGFIGMPWKRSQQPASTQPRIS